MLNRIPPRGELAILRYEDAEFTILRPGRHVICAVSGAEIALEDLRYWNVDLQEAYRGVDEAQARWKSLQEQQP
jgi:hypothetical protein